MTKTQLDASELEIAQIREELSEIEMLADPVMQNRVAVVWASFLRESSYERISDAPAFPGLSAYDLCGHTRQVVHHCAYMAQTMQDYWSLECDREALIAAALTYDSSKLVERGSVFVPFGPSPRTRSSSSRASRPTWTSTSASSRWNDRDVS